MARIPEDEIERLKREVSLERLVQTAGVGLRRHGADLIGLCPFHDDREPSLVVTPGKNLWHCLGACQTGGTVIDWVMKAEGVSFRHAVELLRADVPVGEAAPVGSHPVKTSTVRKLTAPVERDADDAEMRLQVVDFYHDTLKESPEALKYLAARGLTHPEMLSQFRLGFANRTLGLRLPAKNRKAGAEMRTRLETLGIIRESGHEHFNGSLVIPVIDPEGSVRGMYGRKITENLRPGTPLHLYLPGPHRGVWNEEALMVSKEIILCESLIDALTFWCAGFRNVTASYGVGGFTDDHRAAFLRHGVKQVWIAYDRDEAGDEAAGRLKEELAVMGIGSHRVLFPKGLDANEYALKEIPAAQSLEVLLNRAEWLIGSPQAKTAVPAPVIPLVASPAVAVAGDEITIQRDDRRYRIRGMEKNLSAGALKVNVLVSRQDEFHVDTFDLQLDRARAAFIKRVAEELGVKEDVIRKDVGQVFLALERLQSEQIRKALTPAKPEVQLSAEERGEAMALLSDPKLLERILEDFNSCGLVGEESNKLIGYLAAVSRHLEAPLAIVVQSSSAAGKSSLMDAVLQFVPEEECIQYSAMTGQSLYYMGEMDLKHKVLAIVEEEGASRAAYALKLLQSEGVLSIASTGKDAATGKLVTHQYRVEGPVMMFLTTTAIDIDEELMNRCLVLSVNEDREQTKAIHRLQREQQTLEGLLRKRDRQEIVRRHRNAQRLLKPLFVANPFANDLTFLDSQLRSRRDHMKYLTLIRAIALLHQHQRPVKTAAHHGKTMEYIEVERCDIEVANRLVKEVLGRSLDELPAQTRRLLVLIGEMAAGQSDFRFSRRDVRRHTEWSATQVRVHLDRLQELEYVIAHHGGRGQTFVYELVCGAGETCGYDLNLTGWETDLTGPKRGQNGGVTGGSRSAERPVNWAPNSVFGVESEKRTLAVA
jgi:DNA primase